jgi:CheY-like chemotaxis protein
VSDVEQTTYFAPAGRVTNAELAEQMKRSLEDPCVQVVLRAVNGYLLILNPERQILAVNEELLAALHREDPSALSGLRPGEAVNCAHFTEGPDGCGTSRHCRSCGAVLAILASQQSGKPVTGECRLSALNDGKPVAMDFRVHCTPLLVGGQHLTAFVLQDIGAEKRRDVLEQVFLHDFLNSLGGLEGWTRLLQEVDPQSAAQEILALTQSLKEDVLAHRTLVEAERGELAPRKRLIRADEVLEQLRHVFASHAASDGRQLAVETASDQATLFTDRALLVRVLVNMVKNALEATGPADVVRVRFERRDGRPGFIVANPGVIPADVREHLFERSFSTKAEKGRGIGTYSMKLFGERYLDGAVAYTSDERFGTEFSIFLPADGENTPGAAAVAAVAARAGGRVLLVEDDEPLSRLAALFLKRLGLEVTVCRNGQAAEAVFTAAPAAFDLVITDSRMPKLGGVPLGRRLLAIRPDLPVFLCSGSSESFMDEVTQMNGFRGFIAKPFTLPSLAHALGEYLPR